MDACIINSVCILISAPCLTVSSTHSGVENKENTGLAVATEGVINGDRPSDQCSDCFSILVVFFISGG